MLFRSNEKGVPGILIVVIVIIIISIIKRGGGGGGYYNRGGYRRGSGMWLFPGGGGFGGFPGQHPRRNHVRMSLWITLLDVARGGKRPVALGTQSGTNTVEIEIPLGIEDGDNVQYGGLAPGGQDLVIQFRVQPDTRFSRQGLNLYTDQKVSIWDMLLGADADVRNVEGHSLLIKIPPKTQPGTTLRLRQQGLRDRNGQRGDLMVKILPEFPAVIAPEIISAIEQHR